MLKKILLDQNLFPQSRLYGHWKTTKQIKY